MDLINKEKMLFCVYWSSWIQTCKTGDQLYSDTFPNGDCSLNHLTEMSFTLRWTGLNKQVKTQMIDQNFKSNANEALNKRFNFCFLAFVKYQNPEVIKIWIPKDPVWICDPIFGSDRGFVFSSFSVLAFTKYTLMQAKNRRIFGKKMYDY